MQEDVYRRLQQALDRHPVGFAATENGADLRLLALIYTPEQAEIVARMDWHFESTGEIYRRVTNLVDSEESLSRILHEVLYSGGIGYRRRDGELWAIAPFVVGFYEYQVKRLSPDLLAALREYWASVGTGPPEPRRPGQMRVVPIGESVKPDLMIARFEDIAVMIDTAGESIAIVECICRKVKGMSGHACERTARKESCMAFRDWAELSITQGTGRRISREEAHAALAESRAEGLVLMPSNSREAEFVCSCCPDCCGVLAGLRYSKSPAEDALCNYQAIVDETSCTACGSCVEICPIEAVSISGGNAAVDRNRCIGCGVCVVRCEAGAVSLQRKPDSATPPDTLDDLYELYDSLRC